MAQTIKTHPVKKGELSPFLHLLTAAYHWFTRLITLLIITWLLRFSNPQPDLKVQTGAITSGHHFDFATWTLATVGGKLTDHSSSPQHFLTTGTRTQIVRDYFAMLDEALRLEGEMETFYSSPDIADPVAATAPLAAKIERLRAEMARYQPLAESILQEQTTIILEQFGFTTLGDTIPPVSFHVTPLPRFLIISPRDHIEQIHAISIEPGLTIAEQEAIESQIDAAQNVSSLIVPIGGLGTYPTMIYETSSLTYVIETIAHEWAHNWLTLRPLGLNYETTPELRTINETTANLFGKEIGRAVMLRYYPDLAPPPPAPPPDPNATPAPTPTPTPDPGQPPPFDFRAEMHITRLEADRLLAEGQIEAAEAYMESRRQFFIDNGYQIRKLNQAYFAFHGAYADTGGAAGSDPIGPMVVQLRQQSHTLREFMQTIASINSHQALEQLLEP